MLRIACADVTHVPREAMNMIGFNFGMSLFGLICFTFRFVGRRADRLDAASGVIASGASLGMQFTGTVLVIV